MNTVSALKQATSAVHRGRNFEEYTVRVLRHHLSMSLRHVGGKGDGGIDLQGWWWLPSACFNPSAISTTSLGPLDRARVRVAAQCKAEEKKVGPNYVRELEGVVLRNSFAHPPGILDTQKAYNSTADVMVGLLVSASPFTRASLLHAHSSPVPLMLLHLPQQRVENGSVAPPLDHSQDADDYPGSIAFNASLSGATGLFRGAVEPRWERSPSGAGGRPGIWIGDERITSWTPDEQVE